MKIITRFHRDTKTLRIMFFKKNTNDHYFLVFVYNDQKMIQIAPDWFIEQEDYYGDEEITRNEMHDVLEKIWQYTVME